MVALVNKEKKLSDNEQIELLKDLQNIPLLWNQNEKSPKKTDKAEELALTNEGLKRVIHSLKQEHAT